MPDTLFDIHNVSVYRGNRKVLDDFSLRIDAGQHTAILGPNGAGKTTLIKIMTRELYPVVNEDSHIKIMGKDLIDIWQLRQHIGLVSQEFQQDYRTTANGLEVVLSGFFGAVGVHEHNHVSTQHRRRASEVLDFFGITRLADCPFMQLSMGQQRRLLLARAFVHEPRILVLDEPLNSLDVQAAFHVLGDIRRLVGEGVTIVLVTHHIDEIIPEIERVVLLKSGTIRFDGAKHKALSAANLSTLFDTPLEVSCTQGHYHWVPARR